MKGPTARRVVAAAIGAVLLICAIAALPLVSAPAPQISLISTLIAGNVMTAYLLIGHTIQRRAAATALLACAYIVTIVSYNLAPQIVALLPPHLPYPAMAVNAVAHAGFAACFLGFVLLDAHRPETRTAASDPTFAMRVGVLLSITAIASVAAVAFAATLLEHAPVIGVWLPWLVPLFSIAVLIAFVVRVRPSISNTWLALALWASALDSLMVAASPPNAFGSVFVAQVFGLVSCIVIPAVYLIEFNRQYAWLSRSNATFRRQALTDELTGLGNRRYYDARIESLCKDLIAHPASRFAILVIDLDRFKAYNDTFGHSAGDECLRRVARTLQMSLFREGDEAMRYGGEEFVVVLNGVDEQGAATIADRIRRAVAHLEISHPSDHFDWVTVSIGVALAPRDGSTPDRLFAIADAALYKAKRQGRNATAFASVKS